MNPLDRLSRYSNESEQSLLGAVLLNPALLDKIDHLPASAFYDHLHQSVWETINRMHSNGEPIDVVTVAESGNFDLAYLGELAQNSAGTNVKRYAQIISEKATERSLLACASQITAAVFEQIPIRDKLERAQSSVMAIGDTSASKDPRDLATALSDVLDDISLRLEGSRRTESCGFPDIDRIVQLLNPGNLNIIAARPAMGKTAFALSLTHKYAEQGKSVLFISQEMGDTSLAQRSLAAAARVPLQHILHASFHGDELDRLAVGVEKLKSQKLTIDEQTAITLGEVRTKARKVKRKNGLDLLVIDYLQLMAGDGDTRHEEIAQISRGLKKLAMDLKIPVIALSQLNRSLESRTDKRPIMADLRESGQIEQDADTILMLYRDEVYHPESVAKGICEVIVRKNRQGSIGMVPMTFLGDYCVFEPFYGQMPREEQKQGRGMKWN